MIDLDELERLANAATPGPWYKSPLNDAILDHPKPGLHRKLILPSGYLYGAESDAAFIAAARTAVPQLVARVRELEAVLRCDNENMDNGWVIDVDGWYRQCPWCGVAWTPSTDYKERIHSLDCPWRTVLDEEQ